LLDIIEEESSRINALVTDFIAFGRPAEPVLRPTDLRALLYRVVAHGEWLARQQGATLEVEKETTPLFAAVDADQMQQVLLNLLLNALAAVGADGHIRLRAVRRGEQACLEVEDDGCGIAPELHGKIFDPFFTTKDQGTGLGLANASRIVEAHGGKLGVRSAPGAGAVFTVCLPVLEE
jgi:signal transduction histidine kinase